jgi:hypothetical protein
MESKIGRQRRRPDDPDISLWGSTMLSVSDIAKLLEQIPIWKAITTMPKRVAELERQVAALQKNTATAQPTGRECPICGSTMKVLKESPHPEFDFAGLKVHEMECPECGNKTSRDFQPGKGYQ